MLNPFYTNQFKRDYKLQKKRHKDVELLDEVIRLLVKAEPLAAKYKDHSLQGNFKHFRECHIEPNWLLIYKIDDESIYFVRTGTHSDLFK